MRRSTTCYWLILLAAVTALETRAAGAINWKLILKDGTTIECSGAPLIIGGLYTFRRADGTDASLNADQIDLDKTDQANKVDRREFRETRGAATDAPPPTALAVPTNAPILPAKDFDAVVLQSPTPVLVELWASWCGYCRSFEPTLRAVAREYAGRLTVVRIDIDRSPEIARQYGLLGTPTLLLFKQGKVAAISIGAKPKDRVIRMLESFL